MQAQDGHRCCAPTGSAVGASITMSENSTDVDLDLIRVSGGTYRIGTNDGLGHPADGEGPELVVDLGPYGICSTAVTNAEFSAFVDDTDHVTVAERAGWSFVFQGLVAPESRDVAPRVAGTPWWCRIDGADWSHPYGPDSSVEGIEDHPVVHVSWYDALAFCAWRGARLPSEAEWEVAALGGLVGARYPWGDELSPQGRPECNIFDGSFPDGPSPEAEYLATAPVTAYSANGYGLYNMVGNVWEWTSDWFTRTRGDGDTAADSGPGRVIKGGSYLCHDSYCNRYRVAARTWNTPDSTTGNTGFRVAGDV